MIGRECARRAMLAAAVVTCALGCGSSGGSGGGGPGGGGGGAGGGTSASVSLDGTIEGEVAFAKSVAAKRETLCGREGIRIVTSGRSDIDPCHEYDEPYVELHVTKTATGSFAPVRDGACDGPDAAFWGSAEGKDTSTVDVASGELVITRVDDAGVSGTFDLTLGDASGGPVLGEVHGAFTTPFCAP